jgi:hypothetical protein
MSPGCGPGCRFAEYFHHLAASDCSLGCVGALFHHSDTWQLAIDTGAAILRFFMIVLIQHTQARDASPPTQNAMGLFGRTGLRATTMWDWKGCLTKISLV